MGDVRVMEPHLSSRVRFEALWVTLSMQHGQRAGSGATCALILSSGMGYEALWVKLLVGLCNITGVTVADIAHLH
jgi:hypothetical protein